MSKKMNVLMCDLRQSSPECYVDIVQYNQTVNSFGTIALWVQKRALINKMRV